MEKKKIKEKKEKPKVIDGAGYLFYYYYISYPSLFYFSIIYFVLLKEIKRKLKFWLIKIIIFFFILIN